MSKKKTIPELEAEKAANEEKLAQLRHQNERLNNRIRYQNHGDRSKRKQKIKIYWNFVDELDLEIFTQPIIYERLTKQMQKMQKTA